VPESADSLRRAIGEAHRHVDFLGEAVSEEQAEALRLQPAAGALQSYSEGLANGAAQA